MTTAGLVLTGVGALVHVYIWVLESLLWTTDRARATFGTTPQEAAATRSMAYNQGFYNLFLAVTAVVGIGLVVADQRPAGWTLVLAACGSMLAAAVVLRTGGASYTRPAVTQGTIPLLAVVATVIAAA